MKLIKVLLIFLCLLFMYSCETRFEDNTRILVTGNIIDENGDNVSDVQINVYTRRNSGSIFSGANSRDEFLLGSNLSEEDGTFEVVSLLDLDSDFSIEFFGNSNFSNYVYRINTENYIPDDLTFNFEDIQLLRLATVDYRFTRTSGAGNVISLNISYTDGNQFCIDEFDDEPTIPLQSTCAQVRFDNFSLNDNRPDFQSTLKVPFGTEIIFTYTINNGDEIVESYLINQEINEFSFTY